MCARQHSEGTSVCLCPDTKLLLLPAAVLSDYESAEDSEVRGVSVLVFCRAAASRVILAQNPVCVLRSLLLTPSAAIAGVSRYQLACSCAEVWSELCCSVVIAAAEENSPSLSPGIYLVYNPQEKPPALLGGGRRASIFRGENTRFLRFGYGEQDLLWPRRVWKEV